MNSQSGTMERPPIPTNDAVPAYSQWLRQVSPELRWDLPHLEFIRKRLSQVTKGNIRKFAIALPPQHFKPVDVNSLVLMKSGQRKRLGDIVVGDEVITHTGKPQLVTGVHEQGKLPCLKINTDLGRSTVTAFDHPFLTPEGWVKASDLRVGMSLALVPRPRTEPTQQDRKIEEFRLAGYFVGDGCCTNEKPSTGSISCNASITNNESILQDDVVAVGNACGFGVHPNKTKAGKAASFGLSGGVRDWLRAAGLAGHGSYTKRVPWWVFQGTNDQIADFIAAYYDCDGCLSGRGMARNGGVRKDPCIEFASVNRLLLSDVQHLLLRLGIRSRFTNCFSKYKGKPYLSFRLSISSQNDAANFRLLIHPRGSRGDRLRACDSLLRTKFDSQYIEDKIVSIEDVGEVECRCLTVENDHTFTSDDFVVHNTQGTTIRYPLWRMLRNPGIRVGIGTYNQRYANKISRYTKRIVDSIGLQYGDAQTIDSWTLANGSSYIARGVGVGLSGEPLDGYLIDDPFKNREEADSPVIQEKVWEWFMDDVSPRIQQGGWIGVIHTRWNSGDLIGRILSSEDAPNWDFMRLPAIAENQEERDAIHKRQGLPLGQPDPLGREPGEALCNIAFNIDSLRDKERILGAGFATLYQQNDVARGGQFFDRSWFEIVDSVPDYGTIRRIRYVDTADSQLSSACFTAGVQMARVDHDGKTTYYIEDIVRGRWNPGERNDVLLKTAHLDSMLKGYERTWFEQPVFDKGGKATRAILTKLAGYPVRADNVGGSGSKQLRCEPLSDAARAGLVKIVRGPWNATFLTELEMFPKSMYKDQCDAAGGCFSKLSKPERKFTFGVR